MLAMRRVHSMKVPGGASSLSAIGNSLTSSSTFTGVSEPSRSMSAARSLASRLAASSTTSSGGSARYSSGVNCAGPKVAKKASWRAS